jgi:hypothetical protein
MNIAQGSCRLSISNPKVISKASEYLRLVDVKSKSRPVTNEIELGKAMVCLDLACQVASQDYDRHKLMKFSGLGEKEYQAAFSAVQSMLRIKATISVPQLAVKFGCARVQAMAQRNLNEFKTKFYQELPAHQRPLCNFDSPAYPAAALYLTALRAQLKIDKDQLLSDVNCHSEAFEGVCAKWIELFPNLKPPEMARKEQQHERARKKAETKDPAAAGAPRGRPTDGIHAPAQPISPVPVPVPEPAAVATPVHSEETEVTLPKGPDPSPPSPGHRKRPAAEAMGNAGGARNQNKKLRQCNLLQYMK